MPHTNATACPPRLSVVITAYNEGEELGRTIESVRAHTEQSYEIIVVDDGSTDGSCRLVQRGYGIMRTTFSINNDRAASG